MIVLVMDAGKATSRISSLCLVCQSRGSPSLPLTTSMVHGGHQLIYGALVICVYFIKLIGFPQNMLISHDYTTRLTLRWVHAK